MSTIRTTLFGRAYSDLNRDDLRANGAHLGILGSIPTRASRILHWNEKFNEKKLREFQIQWNQARSSEVLTVSAATPKTPVFWKEMRKEMHDAALFSFLYQISNYILMAAVGTYSFTLECAFNATGMLSPIWLSANKALYAAYRAGKAPRAALADAREAVVKAWNEQREDLNSYHPVVELILSGVVLAFIWYITDLLETYVNPKNPVCGLKPGLYEAYETQFGSPPTMKYDYVKPCQTQACETFFAVLQGLMRFGLRKDVLNYMLMNIYFATKATWHAGNWFSSDIVQGAALAIPRGALRNFMMSAPCVQTYGTTLKSDLYDGIPATLLPKAFEIVYKYTITAAWAKWNAQRQKTD